MTYCLLCDVCLCLAVRLDGREGGGGHALCSDDRVCMLV